MSNDLTTSEILLEDDLLLSACQALLINIDKLETNIDPTLRQAFVEAGDRIDPIGRREELSTRLSYGDATDGEVIELAEIAARAFGSSPELLALGRTLVSTNTEISADFSRKNREGLSRLYAPA